MSDGVVERDVEVDGARIHYLECGDGKPLVFLHGAGGAPHETGFITALGERYRVLVPSQPGFDASDPGTSSTVTDLAEVMAAFIRQTAEGPVYLVGESFGGWVACWVTLLHPDLVERLVLAAPAAFRPAPEPGAPPPSPQELALRLFGRLPDAPPSPEESARRQRNAARARGFLSTHWDDALEERLAEIKAPTLLLWSTRDQVVPPDLGEVYHKRIPVAYLMYIYGGAHALPIACEKQFVSLTSDFLERGESFIVNQSR